ncbi:MAG: penicillin-binding protein 2 [Candidatus Aminicenantes bacterium]|nr:penicillin-binding protein 2 [Candidatus Aminicenantes bacterium]
MIDPQRGRVNRRTAWLVLFFGLWTGVLVFRLVQIQILRHGQYKAEVDEQSRNIWPIRPRRGNIVDRGGAILARSLPAQSVFLTHAANESAAEQFRKVETLRDILDLSSAEIKKIRDRISQNGHFTYIKRQVSAEDADRVRALGLPGIALHPETKRFYPCGRLASHVLGGVNIDEKGQAGVEFSYNDVLQGRAGEALVMRDAKRRKFRLETLKDSHPGEDIVLTLDAAIQYIVERELKKAVAASQAAWGSIIVSRPATGEILALANVPDYDPNHWPPSVPGAASNRAVQHNFEPGSTFKIVTAAAALETESVGPAEIFNCRADAVDVPGKAIRDHKPFDALNFHEIFIHSSNIGTIQVGLRTGETELRRMIWALGFGRKTGLDLPGEESGIYRPEASWTPRTLPAVAIGYEISVTAIQVLQAMNVIANRGLSVPPRIVKSVLDPAAAPPPDGPTGLRVLSRATAERLAAILVQSVEEGTGFEAKPDGYPTAGKTGTAQKYDPARGAYVQDKHLASFAGFVPADNPALSIIVVLDEPRGSYYGGQIAAPVFRSVAEQILRYLRISPRHPAPRGLIAAHLPPGGRE